jgi:hypothetical protein
MGQLTCAIHQPNFFPRLSTLAKLYTADAWIILDDVQFARRDYQHRCRLPTTGGTGLPERWLPVPVHLPAGRATLIRDVRLAEPAATARRVPDILRQYYKHAPYAAAILGLLPQLGSKIASSERLADVTEYTTTEMLRLVGWPGAIYRSSDLPARSGRSERLADLTSTIGATTYLCGTGGSRYLDPAPFTARGLHVAKFRPQRTPEALPPRTPVASPGYPTSPMRDRWRSQRSSPRTPSHGEKQDSAALRLDDRCPTARVQFWTQAHR